MPEPIRRFWSASTTAENDNGAVGIPTTASTTARRLDPLPSHPPPIASTPAATVPTVPSGSVRRPSPETTGVSSSSGGVGGDGPNSPLLFTESVLVGAPSVNDSLRHRGRRPSTASAGGRQHRSTGSSISSARFRAAQHDTRGSASDGVSITRSASSVTAIAGSSVSTRPSASATSMCLASALEVTPPSTVCVEDNASLPTPLAVTADHIVTDERSCRVADRLQQPRRQADRQQLEKDDNPDQTDDESVDVHLAPLPVPAALRFGLADEEEEKDDQRPPPVTPPSTPRSTASPACLQDTPPPTPFGAANPALAFAAATRSDSTASLTKSPDVLTQQLSSVGTRTSSTPLLVSPTGRLQVRANHTMMCMASPPVLLAVTSPDALSRTASTLDVRAARRGTQVVATSVPRTAYSGGAAPPPAALPTAHPPAQSMALPSQQQRQQQRPGGSGSPRQLVLATFAAMGSMPSPLALQPTGAAPITSPPPLGCPPVYRRPDRSAAMRRRAAEEDMMPSEDDDRDSSTDSRMSKSDGATTTSSCASQVQVADSLMDDAGNINTATTNTAVGLTPSSRQPSATNNRQSEEGEAPLVEMMAMMDGSQLGHTTTGSYDGTASHGDTTRQRSSATLLNLLPAGSASRDRPARLASGLLEVSQVASAANSLSPAKQYLNGSTTIGPREHHNRSMMSCSTTAIIETNSRGKVTCVNDIEIWGPLGEGSYGAVHVGISPDYEDAVAVKIVPRRLAETAARATRGVPIVATPNAGSAKASDKRTVESRNLVHEAAMMAKLKHDFIVPILQVIDDPASDDIFMVMQLVDGPAAGKTSLREEDGRFACTQLDTETLRLVCWCATKALRYCARRKVVHGDVKPENILLLKPAAGPRADAYSGTGASKALLADFGVAMTLQGGKWRFPEMPSVMMHNEDALDPPTPAAASVLSALSRSQQQQQKKISTLKSSSHQSSLNRSQRPNVESIFGAPASPLAHLDSSLQQPQLQLATTVVAAVVASSSSTASRPFSAAGSPVKFAAENRRAAAASASRSQQASESPRAVVPSQSPPSEGSSALASPASPALDTSDLVVFSQTPKHSGGDHPATPSRTPRALPATPKPANVDTRGGAAPPVVPLSGTTTMMMALVATPVSPMTTLCSPLGPERVDTTMTSTSDSAGTTNGVTIASTMYESTHSTPMTLRTTHDGSGSSPASSPLGTPSPHVGSGSGGGSALRHVRASRRSDLIDKSAKGPRTDDDAMMSEDDAPEGNTQPSLALPVVAVANLASPGETVVPLHSPHPASLVPIGASVVPFNLPSPPKAPADSVRDVSGDEEALAAAFARQRAADPAARGAANRARGTPAFVAPELLLDIGSNNNVPPTPATDLWALGVSLFGCRYGYLPFGGSSPEQLRQSILRDAVPFPEGLDTVAGSDVHEERRWRALLKAMLQKDPTKRISFDEILRSSIMNKCSRHFRLQTQQHQRSSVKSV